MDLSKLPLAEIRRRCDELRRDTERNHWIRTLRADRRRIHSLEVTNVPASSAD